MLLTYLKRFFLIGNLSGLLDGQSSSHTGFYPIITGVLQGSILDATLFFIFIYNRSAWKHS